MHIFLRYSHQQQKPLIFFKDLSCKVLRAADFTLEVRNHDIWDLIISKWFCNSPFHIFPVFCEILTQLYLSTIIYQLSRLLHWTSFIMHQNLLWTRVLIGFLFWHYLVIIIFHWLTHSL